MNQLGARIEVFLDAHHVMTLATVGDSGPHAASLIFARKGFALYWTSDPLSRHSRHLERDARVTATVAPDYVDFQAVRGLQIAGRAAQLVDGEDASEARLLLVRRYAFLAQLAAQETSLGAAFAKASFYRLQPERITLIDNTRGFGHKETLLLSRNAASAPGESS